MMAPESERANCKHERLNMEGVCPCGYWVGDPTAHLREPTLTCSEVVERLQLECVEPCKVQSPLHPNVLDWHYSKLNPEKATAILHSWRERRVQELEELLAKQSLLPEPQSTQLDNTKGESMTTEIRKCQFCTHEIHPRGQKCGVPNPVKPCKCKAGARWFDSIGNAVGEALFGGSR